MFLPGDAALAGLKNSNVKLSFLYRWTFSVTQGLWNLGIGSTFIYMMEGSSNTKVGIAQCIQGTLLALSAIPAGIVADKTRRDSVMRFSGIAMLGAIGCTVGAIYVPQREIKLGPITTDTFFALICLALALWGVAQGAGSSALEALLADSVPTGSRARLYSLLYSTTVAAVAIGPAASAVLFLIAGNDWTIPSLRLVLLVGMLSSLIPACLSFAFSDDKTLGAESQGILASHNAQQGPSDEQKAEEQEEEGKRKLQNYSRGGIPLSYLPAILCASDILSYLGSGMTTKYMPIWLFEKVHMSPVGLNFVQAIMPLCVAFGSVLAQELADYIGRVQSMIAARTASVVTMWVIAQFTGLWAHKSIILPLYCIRFGFMNCMYPIAKSILMDYVPKENRAKWNSLEAVSNFGWSGTSLFGGLLIDHYNYQISFHVTAFVQLLGILPLFLLLPMVPRKDEVIQAAAGDTAPLLEEGLEGEHEDGLGTGEPRSSSRRVGAPSRKSSRRSRGSWASRSRASSEADETPARSSLERPLLGHRG